MGAKQNPFRQEAFQGGTKALAQKTQPGKSAMAATRTGPLDDFVYVIAMGTRGSGKLTGKAGNRFMAGGLANSAVDLPIKDSGLRVCFGFWLLRGF